MKYIITERQLFLIEQPDSIMDRRSQGAAITFENVVLPWCEKNIGFCIGASQFIVWFIPYVGPYLSAAIGVADSGRLFKQGKNVEGFISLLTSPLAFTKLLKIAKVYNLMDDAVIQVIKNIHNLGIPVLISKGKEQFFLWLYNEFYKSYLNDPKFLSNKKMAEKKAKESVENFKKLLSDPKLQSEITKDIKNKISEWKNKNLDKYKLLDQEQKKVVDNLAIK